MPTKIRLFQDIVKYLVEDQNLEALNIEWRVETDRQEDFSKKEFTSSYATTNSYE